MTSGTRLDGFPAITTPANADLLHVEMASGGDFLTRKITYANLKTALNAGLALDIGDTTILSGTSTSILYDNAGTLGEYAISGTGSVAMTNSPTFITPALGTPASGVATNLTGTATGLTAGITNALKSATTTIDVSAATAPTSGQVLTATSGTAATWQTPAGGSSAAQISFVIGDGTNVVPTGTRYAAVRVPFSMTITSCEMVAANTGSIVVDIYMDDYAHWPSATSIVASAPPTISASNKSVDSTLTGWTTSVPAGSYLLADVTSVTDTKQVTINLIGTRA
jgi:hypothetical protein